MEQENILYMCMVGGFLLQLGKRMQKLLCIIKAELKAE